MIDLLLYLMGVGCIVLLIAAAASAAHRASTAQKALREILEACEVCECPAELTLHTVQFIARRALEAKQS